LECGYGEEWKRSAVLIKLLMRKTRRHDGLHEIIEGRVRGKPTRGRRRIQMLHDLPNNDGFVALRRAAEGTEGWRHTQRMLKTCSVAEDW